MTDADDLEIERLLEEFEHKATPPPSIPNNTESSRNKHTSKHSSSSSTHRHHSHKKRRHSHSSSDDDKERNKQRKKPPRSPPTRDFDLDLQKISRSSSNTNPNNNSKSINRPTSDGNPNDRRLSRTSGGVVGSSMTNRERTPELTPEERDARTILCMQLAARIRPRDLEEFFSKANIGKVRDARLITDPRTKRSKGVAYVEFRDLDSVNKAIALSGEKVLGIPIIIKASNAEKNRLAAAQSAAANQFVIPQSVVPVYGPMKLYVGSLHFNITEEMLRGIFEPFGRVDVITLMKDPETGRSRGYAFVQFAHAEDAKRAMENLNGFELAGRPMKVGHVTERQNETSNSTGLGTGTNDVTKLETEDMLSLGPSARLALMAKLSQGSGLEMPQTALDALQAAQTKGVGTYPPH